MNVDVACLPDLIEQMIGGAGRHAIGDADLQREFLGVPGEGLLLGKLESVGRDRDEIGIVDEGQLQMKTRLQRPLRGLSTLPNRLTKATSVCGTTK